MDILIEELDDGLWVAATENGRVTGLEIDPAREAVRWGGIYWGRVMKIDTAMDCAFIDLDGENVGLLHNADVRIFDSKGRVKKGGDVAIGKLIEPGQMIGVQAKSGYLPKDDDDLTPEDKTARVSMDITLPGRYLIYSPVMTENRVSSRVKDGRLKKQLLKMLESIDGMQGCILRSSAVGMQTDILIREAHILKNIWTEVQGFFDGGGASLIMDGPDAIQRTLSDLAGERIQRIEVVTMERFEQAEEWCEIFAPDLVTKIEPIELKDPNAELALFDYRDIMDQIESLSVPYVVMPEGGSLIIQKTSALTAIDVNRGNDRRSALDINLTAAQEIGRHLRLRNLGGIITIDFLKITDKKQRALLLEALATAFAYDPCTVQIHGFTPLGLIELTRQRRSPSLQDRLDSALN
ncbi:MAG: ribonuclease E/G [Alphaproteobacteria bacterium]|nr:ribonuclease E/G [Alphaproteobacteria bacterium]